jgi:hypothetical protein
VLTPRPIFDYVGGVNDPSKFYNPFDIVGNELLLDWERNVVVSD